MTELEFLEFGLLFIMKESRNFKFVVFLLILIIPYLGIFPTIHNYCIAQERKFSPYDFMTTSDNLSIRYGIWSCQKEKKLGSIILLSGRTEFMEKYTETIGILNQKGFDVYSFDWRGQGLSTRMLANMHKGFVENYDNYINDLYMFFRKIVQPEVVSPVIILAHSMGGHISLRFIHDHPEIADGAILLAPMIDILTSPFPKWLARLIVRVSDKAGLDHSYAIGSGDYDPDDEKFEGNSLTSDPERFMDKKKAIAENPDLALGGVTYGWLAATFESIDILTEPVFAEKILIPILIVSAGADKIVSIEAQKAICSLMNNCRLFEISGARHEILQETDVVQSIFWDEFERFTPRREALPSGRISAP
jgi:lysophospholipase